MFEFLIQNPILIVVVVLLFMAFLVIFVLKPNKKSKAKVEKVFATPEKKEQEADEIDKVDESHQIDGVSKKQECEEISEISEKTEISEEPKEKKKIKIFKEKLQPKVEKVYVREKVDEPNEIEKETKSDISEDELLEKMQFVKSSKKVSKLRAITDEERAEKEALLQAQLEEQQAHEHVNEPQEVKKSSKHFDHSRRLSRCIECGSVDELFCPHLSDKYMNINTDRYLRVGDNFEEALYARTSKMLANSGAKIFVDEDYDNEEGDVTPSKAFKNDKEYMKEWLEKRKREEFAKLVMNNTSSEEETQEIMVDDINLNAKNLLVVSSVMKRKTFRRRA